MDFDELFEMPGGDAGDEDGEFAPEPPDFRATLRGHRLNVTNWAPHLLAGGPNGALVRERAADGVTIAERAAEGVTIADLWVMDDVQRELIVRYLAVADRRRADRHLIRWASAIGYSRVWLPDRLVELEPDTPLGSAAVECPTCGAGWRDEGPEFWESVRNCGRFPTLCPICNSDLPQWRWRAKRRSGAPAERRGDRAG